MIKGFKSILMEEVLQKNHLLSFIIYYHRRRGGFGGGGGTLSIDCLLTAGNEGGS